MTDTQFKLVCVDEIDPSHYIIKKPIDGVEFTEYERGYNHAIDDAHRLIQKAEDLSYLLEQRIPIGLNGEVTIQYIDRPRKAHWIMESEWVHYWDTRKSMSSKRIVNIIRCSNCRQGWLNNIDLFKSFNRCPNCGAEMVEKYEYR